MSTKENDEPRMDTNEHQSFVSIRVHWWFVFIAGDRFHHLNDPPPCLGRGQDFPEGSR